MKIKRSTKFNLKYLTATKLKLLKSVISEYSKLVNIYIDKLWNNTPESKFKIPLETINNVDSFACHRFKKNACQEALGLVQSAKILEGSKPKFDGKHISVNSTIGTLNLTKGKEFDGWLILTSIGNKIRIDIPIKLHKHFYKLQAKGKLLNYFIITDKTIQICFEIKTVPKKLEGNLIGIDSGINALASTSNGQQFGKDIKKYIDRERRCKQGSKGYKRAIRAKKQYINEVARDVVNSETRLVVVEKLKNLSNKTKVKRSLTKNMRRVIGSWTYAYWLGMIERRCEENCVSFRTVSPYNTSRQCSSCGYTDKMNRNGEIFKCLNCNHTDNADLNAAKNILSRFITGQYGACFKVKV